MARNIKNIDHLIMLTKFVSSGEMWEEEQVLYQQFDEYLIEGFCNLPHFVFSHSIDSKGRPIKKKLRSLWNREIMKTIISAEELFQKIKKIFKNKKDLSGIHTVNINGTTLQIFNYGMSENQYFWGVIPTLGGLKTDKEVLEYLLKYLQNSFHCIQEIKLIKTVSALAFVDDITGFYNHRKLHEDVIELIERYDKIDEELAILFIDIDHFKDVNDGFGHIIGTQLLTDFSDRLRYLVRDTDFIYRYGGDEFVVILTNTKYIRVKEIGERILQGILSQKFKLNNEREYPLSISIGIAKYPEDASTGKEIINIADEMMYTAKKQGRGRVCMTGELNRDRR